MTSYKILFEKHYEDGDTEFKDDVNLVINNKLSSDDIIDLLDELEHGVYFYKGREFLYYDQLLFVFDKITTECDNNITNHVILRMFDIFNFDKYDKWKVVPCWLVNLINNNHVFTTQQHNIILRFGKNAIINLEKFYKLNVKKISYKMLDNIFECESEYIKIFKNIKKFADFIKGKITIDRKLFFKFVMSNFGPHSTNKMTKINKSNCENISNIIELFDMMEYEFTEDCVVFILIEQINIVTFDNYYIEKKINTSEVVNIFIKILENKKEILKNVNIQNVLMKCIYLSEKVFLILKTLGKLELLDKKKVLKCAVLYGCWDLVREYMDNKIFLEEHDIYLLLNMLNIDTYLPYLIINTITFDPKNLIPIFALEYIKQISCSRDESYLEYIKKFLPDDKINMFDNFKNINITEDKYNYLKLTKLCKHYNNISTLDMYIKLYEQNHLNITIMSNDIMIALLNNKNITILYFFFDMYAYKPNYFQIMSLVRDNTIQLALLAMFYPEQYKIILKDFFDGNVIEPIKPANITNEPANITKQKLSNDSDNINNKTVKNTIDEKPKKSTKRAILKKK